jgi:Fungal chitosanase of glycosyl hydrolase group 75
MKSFGLTIMLLISALVLSAAKPPQYSPPPASAGALTGIKFDTATPVDEFYRAQFDRCDRENKFKSQTMTGSRKCGTDKNNAKALLKFPNGAIFFESKLSLDKDGSWAACNSAASTDQCPTWYRWPGLTGTRRYVDADTYPYVVIPIAGLNGDNDPEFRNKTGIAKGDVGVVVFKDKVVPVFVADGGPHNKLGEGSTALLKAIGEDRCREWKNGHCERFRDVSVPGGVLCFLFPQSSISGLTPANALERVRVEAMRRFEELKTAN